MYLIIIAVLIGIIIGVYNAYDDGYDWLEYLMYPFLGVVVGGVIGLAVAIALPMDTYQRHYTLTLEGLQDNNNISGNFFLGCGQIEGKMKYVFYYKSGEFYRMAQVDYELVNIKYSTASPKVNVSEKYPTESFINNFAIDTDCYNQTYIMEVPKGTIKNNYTLDAQ